MADYRRHRAESLRLYTGAPGSGLAPKGESVTRGERAHGGSWLDRVRVRTSFGFRSGARYRQYFRI